MNQANQTNQVKIKYSYIPTEYESKIFDIIYQFVIESTIKFDDSHNHMHALEVYKLSKKIIDEFVETDYIHEYDYLTIMMASLLHDVCDDKYVDKSISKDDLYNFIYKIDQNRSEMIIKIINNISYSKEVKGLLEKLPYPYNIYRDVISDADKIFALGEIGIKRCERYTRESNPNIQDDKEIMKLVIKHCHDKLLRLYPEHFIKTEPGRKFAEPEHQIIVNFVK